MQEVVDQSHQCLSLSFPFSLKKINKKNIFLKTKQNQGKNNVCRVLSLCEKGEKEMCMCLFLYPKRKKKGNNKRRLLLGKGQNRKTGITDLS